MTKKKTNLKWAIGNQTISFPRTERPRPEVWEAGGDFGDFNGPLVEQDSFVAVETECQVDVIDLADVKLAEERLANPDDRSVPFKPSA